MTDTEHKRPEPESLLEIAQQEETAKKRGKLTIYFGAAPGVGKTYSMLSDARIRKKEGIDIVVGYVETHGRAAVSYTHLRAHETRHDLVCRLLLEKKKKKKIK